MRMTTAELDAIRTRCKAERGDVVCDGRDAYESSDRRPTMGVGGTMVDVSGWQAARRLLEELDAIALDRVRIGAAQVELHANGLTVTRYADGTSVPAIAHSTAEYLARARAHGYGDDVAAMSRDHEITHSLLAWLFDGGASPALWRVAHGEASAPVDDIEEAAVMALQRWARARGVDIVTLARGVSLPQ